MGRKYSLALGKHEESEHGLIKLSDEGTPAPERLEKLAQTLMSSGLSAEEYAGRHGDTILMCSIHRYQYQSVKTNDWVHRLGHILSTPGLLAQYQEKYLTPAEWEAVKKVSEEF